MLKRMRASLVIAAAFLGFQPASAVPKKSPFSSIITTRAIELEQCNPEVHACQCEEGTATPQNSIRVVTFDSHCARIIGNAKAFESISGINVAVECLGYNELHEEILSDVTTQTGYYDGFMFGPHATGDMVQVDGLHDLTPFVRDGGSEYDLRWNDLLRFNRENAAVYDNKVVLIPLDGDVLSLYYRMDLFKKYGKSPPKTWEEYSELARFFHGKTEPLPGSPNNETVTISGSCIGRKFKCQELHWIILILSSMTQYAGTKTGFLFNPSNMEPLLGEAFVKTLQFTEEQFSYGADNELEGCFDSTNIAMMNAGRCAMTYNWGDQFTEGSKQPPTSFVSGLIGTTHTPSSTTYLDRESQKLIPCTQDVCACNQGSDSEASDRCTNVAPYAAFTGWSGGVNNYASPARKVVTSDFFAFASSPAVSLNDTIPNITAGAPYIGCDPFRESHLNAQDWIDHGLPEQQTKMYLSTIREQQSHSNVVLDMRIPYTTSLLGALQEVFNDHLSKINAKKVAGMEGEELFSTEDEKWAVERNLRSMWKDLIDSYNKENSPDILEVYQRSLGIYSTVYDFNYIGPIRWFGWALAALVLMTSLSFARWVIVNRKKRIVRASQPMFLLMICAGAFLIGAGIIPLGIDDEIATIKGCDIACMSWPWLFSCGFVIAFAALFSKITRVVKLFNNPRFKRIVVKEKDVIQPLVAMLVLNIGLLMTWTFVDPLVFKRIQTGPSSSYGTCGTEGKGVAARTFASLITAIDITALIAANVQAFRARGISDEFSESKYIALSMFSILQGIIISLPLYFLIRDQPATSFLVLSALAFMIAMSLLVFIFCPKIYLARKRAKKAKTEKKDQQQNAPAPSNFSRDSGTEGIRIITAPRARNLSSQADNRDEKLDALKLKLVEQGVDANGLFREIGLDAAMSANDTMSDGTKRRSVRGNTSDEANGVAAQSKSICSCSTGEDGHVCEMETMEVEND